MRRLDDVRGRRLCWRRIDSLWDISGRRGKGGSAGQLDGSAAGFARQVRSGRTSNHRVRRQGHLCSGWKNVDAPTAATIGGPETARCEALGYTQRTPLARRQRATSTAERLTAGMVTVTLVCRLHAAEDPTLAGTVAWARTAAGLALDSWTRTRSSPHGTLGMVVAPTFRVAQGSGLMFIGRMAAGHPSCATQLECWMGA
jgi:hypothetical protein